MPHQLAQYRRAGTVPGDGLRFGLHHVELIGAVAVVALFPAVFLYQTMLALGLMPPVLGGMFGPLSALFAIVFAPFLAVAVLRAPAAALPPLIVWVLLLILAVSYFAAHSLFGFDYQKRGDVAFQVQSTIIMWFALFCVGFFFPRFKQGWFPLMWLGFAAMVGFTLANVNPQSMMFYAREVFGDKDEVGSYQLFSRSFIYTFFIVLMMTDRAAARIGALAIGLPTLFLLGARAEFYGFLMVLPLVLLFEVRRNPARGGAISLFLILGFVAFAVVFADQLAASRQIASLLSSGGDSVQTRLYYLQQGWQALSSNIILGDYAGHVRDFGYTGAYIHNVVSTWRHFGLAGFLLYGVLTALTTTVALRHAWVGRGDRVWCLAAVVNLYVVVLMIVAKPVFDPLVGLAWGLSSGGLWRYHRARNAGGEASLRRDFAGAATARPPAGRGG